MTTIHQHDPKGYGALAPVLVNLGYIPIPCQGKQPRLQRWQNARAEQITALLNDHAGDNTGVVLGDTLLVADIDIKDNATAAQEVAQQVQEVFGAGAVISRTGVTSIKIFYRTEAPIKKRALSLKHGKLEILGSGQQAIVAGKLEGSEYQGELPSHEELPLVTEAMIDKLFAALRPMHETEKPEPAYLPGAALVVDDPAAWARSLFKNKLAKLKEAVDQQVGNDSLFKSLSCLLAYDEHLPRGWLGELKCTYLGLVRAKWPEDPRHAERKFEDTLRSARKKARENPMPPLVKQKPEVYKIFTAADLGKRVFPPVDFTVEGLLVPGLTLLAGAPKLGKSWLALQLGLSVAAGMPFLDRPTKQGKVLYMALEDNERRLAGRIKVAQRGEPTELSMYCDPIPLEDLDLKAWRLVIIDTLGRWRGMNSTQYNYQADVKVLAEVQQAAIRSGCSMLLIHHTNKNEKSSDSFSLISGTQGIAGTADTTMVLTRRRNTNAAKLEFTGRDIEEGVLNLAVDETTRMADLADPPQNMNGNADRLLAAMPEDGAEINNARLAKLAGTDRSNMTRDIAPLLQEGSVECVRRGVYRRRINAADPLQLELPFEDAT